VVRAPERRAIGWHAALGALLSAAVMLVGFTGTASSSPRPSADQRRSGSAATTTTRAFPGFSAVSVTFVSAGTGWVLGTVPAGPGAKLAVDHTVDGGTSWSTSSAPDVTYGAGGAVDGAIIRFADPEDGWIAAPAPTNGSLSLLWSTHDGGASWHRVAVPGGGGVAALEASGGVFQLATMKTGVVQIYSTPAARTAWARSATRLPLGAGPVPSAELVLQGSAGWLVENDRTVVAGARLASGRWERWAPPCRNANGSVSLAASSTTDLVAVCDEGVWGPPGPGTTAQAWLFASDDAGGHFRAVGQIVTSHIKGVASVGSVAMPPGKPQVVVVGGLGIGATFDGGRTWRTVYSGPPAREVRVVGFITARQGVAILTGGARSSALLMTRDGGETWRPVTLPRSATR
jgi:photosystem II stability/assembly factor-like uncharacterized protein